MTSSPALPGTTILNLPPATTVTGSEWIPMVQGAVTVRGQTGSVVNSLTGSLQLVLVSSAPVGSSNARQLAAQSGVTTITDGGPSGQIIVGVAANGVSSVQIRQSTGLSVVGNPSTSVANVSDIAGTANQTLVVNSAGTSLGFGQLNVTSSNAVSGVLNPNFGGTGSSVFTPFQLIAAGSASSAAFQSLAVGTSGFILTYTTSSTLPTWQAQSGFVAPGTANQVAYYSSNGDNLIGSPDFNFSSATATVTVGLASSTTGNLALANSGGAITTFTPGTATVTLTGAQTTTTLIGKDTVDTLTGKTYDTAGSSNIFKINGTQVSTASDVLSLIGTSTGNLLYHSTGTGWAALAIGTSNQVLTGGTIPQWAAPAGVVVAGTSGQVAYFSSAGNSLTGSSILSVSSAVINVFGTGATGISGSSNFVLGSTATLTSPILVTAAAAGTWTSSATWTLPAHTLGGTISGGANQINNVVIGASQPLAGTFTTITASVHNSTSSIQFQVGGSSFAGQISSGYQWSLGSSAPPAAGPLLTLNQNTGTPVASFVGTPSLHTVSPDGAIGSWSMDIYGAQGFIASRYSGGTQAAKTAVGATVTTFSFGGQTWDGTSYNSVAAIDFNTVDAQSTSDHSGQITFRTVSTGTTSLTQKVQIQSGFSVGTVVDPGLGLIYQNSSQFLMRTKTAWTNGAGAVTPVITNAPSSSPTKWIPIDDNGTTRFIPAW
jgi:hypothetical protein